ncbi:MAG: hypothetical protein JWM11_500 [Planctomycetaceae bacterium]|nr:hypothetical protein [Planctomycetaceae bacterium]
MFSFFQSAFAWAGLAAASGPVIIHLLNRRRFRVVEWAAMDFLRQALQRNRKMLQLRDIILLALRTLCVLLFGLALARPFWQHQSGVLEGRGAVHAVVILDNSRSMGFARLDGTLLDEAKQKTEEFLGQLPTGSRVSVVPLCGPRSEFTLEPFRSLDDARDALRKIRVVDREGTAGQAADLALDACRLAPDLPAKRVVFLGDQQEENWPRGQLDQLQKLPEMQIVQIGADTVENAWIEKFRLQDGIADIETPTSFLAVVAYEGAAPKTNVQISLEVDGASDVVRNIDLEPGQRKEVQFPYRFSVPVEQGKATFVKASVRLHEDTLPGDRLSSDNQRFAVVPVVSSLPVVFVDQLGEKENTSRGEYGESFHLRQWLSPVTTRGDTQRQLVTIRHTTIENLNQAMLQDARLVVISGVANPGSSVPLLREYVQQGGQLVITAGAQFDQKAWTNTAWMDGAGIIPAPLQTELVGKTPEESAGQLAPFQLAANSLGDYYFHIEDISEDDRNDLYQTPLFFKMAVADVSAPVIEAFTKSEAARLTNEFDFLRDYSKRKAEWARQEAQGALTGGAQQEKQNAEARQLELRPQWLAWPSPQPEFDVQKPVAEMVKAEEPTALGRFTDEHQSPVFVKRRIGKGLVVFFSSGVFSDWNDLPKRDAILVFDRIFRSMLEDTFPRRTIAAVEQFTLPVESADRHVNYSLTRPGQAPEALSVGAVDGANYGVSVRELVDAGYYLISATRVADSADADATTVPLWEVPLAVNGPIRESNLRSIDAPELRKRLGNANYRWIERDEPISLEGAQISLQNLWKWLIWMVLVGLLLELVILAWPNARRGVPPKLTTQAPGMAESSALALTMAQKTMHQAPTLAQNLAGNPHATNSGGKP